jgi:excisionase family DNA binding protein
MIGRRPNTSMSSNTDRLLTIDEAARRLSISASGIYRLRATKKIFVCKVGKRSIRIKESVVDRYIKSLRDD